MVRRYIRNLENDINLPSLQEELNKITGAPEKAKPKVAAAAKARRKRKPRTYRTFAYRGVTFFFVAKGDNTQICIVKPGNIPEPIIEVPRANAMAAARDIAKITLTENHLETLQSKKQESLSE